jgi:hypothetical protein
MAALVELVGEPELVLAEAPRALVAPPAGARSEQATASTRTVSANWYRPVHHRPVPVANPSRWFVISA